VLSGKAADALLRFPDAHWRCVGVGCVSAWPEPVSTAAARRRTACRAGGAAEHTPAGQTPNCQQSTGDLTAAAHRNPCSNRNSHADREADYNTNNAANCYTGAAAAAACRACGLVYARRPCCTGQYSPGAQLLSWRAHACLRRAGRHILVQRDARGYAAALTM